MPRARKPPSKDTKLAATLLMLGLVRFEDAKAMGETNFLSLFQFDHGDQHAEGGSDEFWNYTPRLIPPHRVKSATVDAPAIAKARTVRTVEAIHRAALASKAGDYSGAAQILAAAPKPPRQKRRIPSRPFAQGHRPIPSRPFRRAP